MSRGTKRFTTLSPMSSPTLTAPADLGRRSLLLAPLGKPFVTIGWALWIIFAIVVAVRVGLHPEKNSVSACYRGACAAWWSGREMYDDLYNGFIYLPHAALFYTPFQMLPLWLGESLNRIAIIALTAWSVWRITRLTSTTPWNEYFFAVSAITIGVGAGNAINGQYNLPLAGTIILAVCSLIERRWWSAAIWLVVSILLKPIAVAPVLLAIALFPAMWWRVPIVSLCVFFVPLLFSIRDPHYAWAEYQTFWNTVLRATLPLERRFAEFSTVLWWFGWDLNNAQRTLWRAAAALITLGLSFVALLRHGAFRGTLLMWALGTAYLMLFNPRTEGLTYVIVAPAVALFGLFEAADEKKPTWRRAAGFGIIAMGIVMIFVHELMPRTGRYAQVAQGSKDLLVRPIMTMLFYLWLTWLALIDRSTPADFTRGARSSPSPCS